MNKELFNKLFIHEYEKIKKDELKSCGGKANVIHLPLNASISLKLVPNSWFNKVLFPAQSKEGMMKINPYY